MSEQQFDLKVVGFYKAEDKRAALHTFASTLKISEKRAFELLKTKSVIKKNTTKPAVIKLKRQLEEIGIASKYSKVEDLSSETWDIEELSENSQPRDTEIPEQAAKKWFKKSGDPTDKKKGMSNVMFLVLFLFFMTLTYIWRFLFAGVAAGVAFEQGDVNSANGIASTANLFMLLTYIIMAYLAYRRGKATGKGYIGAFPVVGAVFDIILVFVPFVPTIMNIITLVLGILERDRVEAA